MYFRKDDKGGIGDFTWLLNYKGFENNLTSVYCSDSSFLCFDFKNNIGIKFSRRYDYPQDYWSFFVCSHGYWCAEGFCQSEDTVRVLKWASELKDGWTLKENE